jgi:hypothetical protein
MARTKGTLNKKKSPPPETTLLRAEERLTFIANLIVDQLIDDQKRNYELLAELIHHYE